MFAHMLLLHTTPVLPDHRPEATSHNETMTTISPTVTAQSPEML